MTHDNPKPVRAALAAAALSLFATASIADTDFPSRPVTLIVPYAAGGGTDAIARTLALALAEKWGKSVIVENRPGAEGIMGTQKLLREPADGHTLLMQLNSMLLYEWLHASSNIHVLEDLTPISKIQESPLVVTVLETHPAKTLQQLFDGCKASGTCSYGTATADGKLVGHQIEQISGAKMTAVPYKGTSSMVNDLLGNHLEIAMISANLAIPFKNDGKARPLAVGTENRFKGLEDVPTFVEAVGTPINGTAWYGIFTKSGTPPDIVEKIESSLLELAGNEKILTAIDSQGATPIFNSSAEFKQQLVLEHQQVSPAAQEVFKELVKP